jgi:hypothetical protein
MERLSPALSVLCLLPTLFIPPCLSLDSPMGDTVPAYILKLAFGTPATVTAAIAEIGAVLAV